MDSEFQPYKFHPTKFALDPYDLLLTDGPKRPLVSGTCSCKNEKHPNHPGRDCGITIERHNPESKVQYVCFDCRKARRTERELNYVQRGGYKLRNHV